MPPQSSDNQPRTSEAAPEPRTAPRLELTIQLRRAECHQTPGSDPQARAPPPRQGQETTTASTSCSRQTRRDSMRPLLLWWLGPAQSTDTIDDAMPVGVSDCLDQVLAVGAVIAGPERSSARRQMPLDSIALTTRGDLAARSNYRPPVDSALYYGRSRFGFGLARRPLAAGVRGRFDRGCSHGDLMVRPEWRIRDHIRVLQVKGQLRRTSRSSGLRRQRPLCRHLRRRVR